MWNPAAVPPPVAPVRSGGLGRSRGGRVLVSVLGFLAIVGVRVGLRVWLDGDDGGSGDASSTEPFVDLAAGDPVDELAVGDCYDDLGYQVGQGGAYDATVEEVACAGRHDAEVFLITNLPHGPDQVFPGDDRVFDDAAQLCLPEFGSFVGVPYETSSLDFTVIYPSSQTWAFDDDRLVVCSVSSMDGSELSGSMRGTGR